MRLKAFFKYVAAGAVLGASAGALLVLFSFESDSQGEALRVSWVLAGALLGAGGGVAEWSVGHVAWDSGLGALFCVFGFASLVPATDTWLESASTRAFAIVIYVLAAGAAIGVRHTWRLGVRVALPAGLFAGIGSLGGVALAAALPALANSFASFMLAGAGMGALLWGGVALAKAIFGVRAESFRVS